MSFCGQVARVGIFQTSGPPILIRTPEWKDLTITRSDDLNLFYTEPSKLTLLMHVILWADL